MPDVKQAPETMLRFSGTPAEIGGQIWERMCLPAVRKVSNEMAQKQLAQLYAGFYMSLLGALTADFGQEFACQFASDMLASFSNMDIDGAARTQ